MGRLDGRRVLVTGASSGIGRATAEAAAAAGARVALLARRREVLDDVAAALDGAVVVPADVADAAAAAAAVDEAAEALGGLDAVVNSAGLAAPARVLEGDPADWRAMVEVNVLGLLAVSQAAAPHLVAAAAHGRADLVNVSSMSGRRRPSDELTVYAATKHAVHVLSDGLRAELHPRGVGVTIVSPGYVDTPIFTDGPRTASSDDYAERVTTQGLPVTVVADAVVHALGQPRGAALHEVAMLALGQ